MNGGVSYYTKGTITDEVSFPENKVACEWCKYLKTERIRCLCLITHEILVYPTKTVGALCPIILEKGE